MALEIRGGGGRLENGGTDRQGKSNSGHTGRQLPGIGKEQAGRSNPVRHLVLPILPVSKPCIRQALTPQGIGNPAAQGPHPEGTPALITPHGDWKPPPGQGMEGRMVRRLTTPHGDWKQLDLRGRPRLPRLITPHGDWKLLRGVPVRLVELGSLPLMGIGNQNRDPGPVGERGDLITPHGDWKPASGAEGGTAMAPTHYPSWGIGNTATTCSTRLGWPPHYLSWGLETSTSKGATP